jgi:alpha-L-arabinofuranosidase
MRRLDKMKKNICTIAAFWFLFLLCPLYAADTAVTIDAGTVVYTIPDTLYGCNLVAWSGNQDGNDLLLNEFMQASNRKFYRWPGGSWGDSHIWDDMEEGGASTWIISYTECLNFLSKIGGTMQPIVNCGGVWDGTQHTNAEAVNKAVAWVTDMNVTRKLGIKYWEIGNEMGGSWEAGYCATGTEYAQRYCNFFKGMKAVDPTIKCGADSDPCEDCDNSWMDLMFTECKNQGVTPDFLIIHTYPTINQTVSSTNDAVCLSAVDNIKTYTDNLNAMVTKYFGASSVGKIEYALTEFSATPADHLYLDAMYNSQVILECARNKWTVANPWAEDVWYRNGYVTPTFYIFPFLQYKFGRQMVTAATNNSLVRAYAAKDSAGNLTVFIVNNSPTDGTTATISVSGFTPAGTGEEWLIEPVRTGLDSQIPDSTQLQEKDDVKINGVVHPDPRIIDTQAWSNFIATGTSFSVTLAASDMAFIRILPSGQTPVPHAAATAAPTATPAPLSATGPVKVQYKCLETATSTTSGRFGIDIVNGSSSPIALSDLVIRYWYTREGPIGYESITCDWAASLTASAITANFYNIYHYMDIHLGTGTIAAGGDSGEVQLRWNYGDYSAMDQSNDYSFSPAITSMTDYMKITLYLNGTLIWGTEPEGLRPPALLNTTPAPTAVPTAVPTIAPSAAPTAVPTVGPTAAPGTPGDVNGNGSIDIVDALLVAQYYVGLNPAGFIAANADVNCSGTIDIVDALLVAQYYVGLNPAGFTSANADVNCSGTIDIVDALLVAQYYVGLINGFC